MMEMLEKMYSASELAALLSVDDSTIYAWKDQGILPYYTVGNKAKPTIRFAEADVLAALKYHPAKYGGKK